MILVLGLSHNPDVNHHEQWSSTTLSSEIRYVYRRMGNPHPPFLIRLLFPCNNHHEIFHSCDLFSCQ